MGHQADAILIGASNLRPDNPDLAIPAEEHAARQTCGGPDPTRIVLTSNGDGISPDMRMFDPARGGASIVVHAAWMLPATRALLAPVDVAELLARAVDVLYLTLVPRILGGARAPTVVEGPGFAPDEIPDPTLASIEHVGDELYLRYEFAWG